MTTTPLRSLSLINDFFVCSQFERQTKFAIVRLVAKVDVLEQIIFPTFHILPGRNDERSFT
jgi:hypothetical protein